MINFLRKIFEKRFFGVCSWIGFSLGLNNSLIRLFFIYATFTNAITVLIYLFILFFLRMRDYFRFRKRKSVFDL